MIWIFVLVNWQISKCLKTNKITKFKRGAKAPQAAGRIHTDFEKGFIMANVMQFVDYKEGGSDGAVEASGGYRQQGKNYTVEDGDIIFFKFNAGAGLTASKKKQNRFLAGRVCTALIKTR